MRLFLLDLLRNSIYSLKLPFLASLPKNFSTMCSHMLSKFSGKSAQKLRILSSKASCARGLLCLLTLFPFYLSASETSIEANEAHYDGIWLSLTGSVAIENVMGKITAAKATLKRDVEKQTKLDFPWIEFKEAVCLTLRTGGVLNCETLIVDYTKMTSLFQGNSQVTYSDSIGAVYADRAQVDYQEIDGSLHVTKVTLFDNIRLINLGTAENPAYQYALAEVVFYYPQEQLMILEGNRHHVLFFDKIRDLQLSAPSVRAQRDPVTHKESIQGVGAVRFLFGPEELERIKQRFFQNL